MSRLFQIYEMYVREGLRKRHTGKHGTRIQKALSFTDVSLYTEITVNVLLKMHLAVHTGRKP